MRRRSATSLADIASPPTHSMPAVWPTCRAIARTRQPLRTRRLADFAADATSVAPKTECRLCCSRPKPMGPIADKRNCRKSCIIYTEIYERPAVATSTARSSQWSMRAAVGGGARLALTQPTIGRHVEALEDALGLTLFVRSQRRAGADRGRARRSRPVRRDDCVDGGRDAPRRLEARATRCAASSGSVRARSWAPRCCRRFVAALRRALSRARARAGAHERRVEPAAPRSRRRGAHDRAAAKKRSWCTQARRRGARRCSRGAATSIGCGTPKTARDLAGHDRDRRRSRVGVGARDARAHPRFRQTSGSRCARRVTSRSSQLIRAGAGRHRAGPARCARRARARDGQRAAPAARRVARDAREPARRRAAAPCSTR